MSGICGISNAEGEPVDRPLLQKLTAFMAFRGPDAEAVWIDGAVGFGHALLRTTFEAEHESQPASLDGTVWITADARIDGQDALKKTLAGLGRTGLAGANDAQLILHAFHAWGEDCVTHLIGDFAFAIWDGPRQQLFCARDQFGIKPFFYTRAGGNLVFSNTLNCLRQHPAVAATLDDLFIADFLLFEMSQDPAATAFADIRRLPPAHCLLWSKGQFRSHRYWQLPANVPVRYRPKGDYVEHFRFLLETAVADRLRTDRVGVDMSGGLDSSSIACTAKALLSTQAGSTELRAHTVVYDKFFADQERFYATLVAEKLGIPIEYCVADSFALFDRAGQRERKPPEPFHDPHAAIGATSMRQAAAHCRVMLTGWDGDALLNESPKPYFRSLLAQRKFAALLAGVVGYAWSQKRVLPLGVRDWLSTRKPGSGGSGPAYPDWISPQLEQRFDLRTRWQSFLGAPARSHPIRPAALNSLSFLTDLSSFFDFYDPGTTQLPLEYRHPLLDLRLVEFALSLPPWPWCIKKHILREAMRGLLPEPVRRRPKAPLAGYPYLDLLQMDQSQWVDWFIAFPGLNRYLVRDKIPSTWRQVDPDATWMNLRPLSLDLWLKAVHPTDH